MIMKKNLLLIVISAILSLLILWPIRQTGAWYPMHDSTHSARILLMQNPISSGQIPPIWAETINGGFGYPLFQFYAPLFHTVGTLLSFPIFPITSAIKVVLYFSFFTGILGVMIFARRWGRIAAIVSGVAFAIAPYVAVNIYVRGAFSEYLSIALLPWVFLTTERILSRKKMVIAAVMLSLFVLSHNLIPILVLPMILIWIIFNNRSRLNYVLGTITLSILLSAWFVLPLLFERGFTQADQVARTTNYSLHFVEPWQLWNSTWGFGGSGSGIEDGMSFKLGKVHIILGLIGIAFAFIQRKSSLILLSIFALISLFLATPYSKFIWDSASILQIVQFPWRALGIISLILAIFAGFAVSRLPSKILRVALGAFVVGLFIFLNYKYFAPQTIITSPLDNIEITESDILDIAKVVPEYAPIWLSIENREIEGSTIIPRAYYPTWEITLDGKKVPTYPSVDGKLAFYNPSGSTNYSYHQSHTNLEKFASILSLITFIGMITVYVKA